ncbi:amidohydrolase family protein [Pseudoponticoccus marisrubri]|uniref:Amidohydrolase n=1 Tax=Pseudoponticoccus marisrubri TaxID=1685382 RepID=A0A0W7WFH6_9RHOB|nr:amidohydrolase family protein [Pseudoponticoccus marisrubri]KUF09341.1 amidohydrolase [Pseudoponticoccus marisrubri]
MDRIDAHHHFWQPARGDYGWMPPDDPVLTRPYGPAELAPGLAATGVTRTVLVQAAPSVAETEYMLGLADATPHVAGVVGWIDFERPDSRAELERLARHPKFLGVRPMIQDLPDDGWMLRDEVQWAYRALVEMDLSFDALGFPRHIPYFRRLLDRHPDLRVVLDHGLKPQIRDPAPAAFDDWTAGISALARDSHATIKLSGLLTEADTPLEDDALRPYTDHILAAFGAARVMWGSDWPVLRLRAEYADWYAQACRLTAHLDATDQAQIFGGTAARFYRL